MSKKMAIINKIFLLFAIIILLPTSTGCMAKKDRLLLPEDNEEKIVHVDVQLDDKQIGTDNKEDLILTDEGTDLKPVKKVAYEGSVQHIFFHPLIAFPELAFDGDRMEKGYNDYFVTVDEFNKVIKSLYEKDFILVDINSLIEEIEEDGNKVIKKKQLMLPEGKKPLIISIDDLNYYKYMLENGNVYKLILDQDGNIATYSITPQGDELISRDNEIVPLLDKFVLEHPDFSHDGAKGVIALTGYEGVLGYRTNKKDSPEFEKEKEGALKVIKHLKETGWTFASHGYGHLDASRVSKEKLVRDTRRWREEVGSLVGPTSIYIYPYGSRVLPGDPKFDVLVDEGFNILCAVGSGPYEKLAKRAYMQDRRHIDGIAFLTQRNRFLDLFDSAELVDPVRPKQIKE
ncbi:MAG: Polysaccharide deacetylase [Xylanivirga thermophila]|uniref:polysaccharide deacetylase family protein n=1 Tax=Xylanivirga thermophila TaxID=2496273 RepID=UPI0039F57500